MREVSILFTVHICFLAFVLGCFPWFEWLPFFGKVISVYRFHGDVLLSSEWTTGRHVHLMMQDDLAANVVFIMIGIQDFLFLILKQSYCIEITFSNNIHFQWSYFLCASWFLGPLNFAILKIILEVLYCTFRAILNFTLIRGCEPLTLFLYLVSYDLDYIKRLFLINYFILRLSSVYKALVWQILGS